MQLVAPLSLRFMRKQKCAWAGQLEHTPDPFPELQSQKKSSGHGVSTEHVNIGSSNEHVDKHTSTLLVFKALPMKEHVSGVIKPAHIRQYPVPSL